MKKFSVLAWSDAPTAGTGFGTVSKHVLSSIYSTGRYEIDQLAINFHGDFVDRNVIPWQMQPARLLDPRDPHGIKMFKRALQKSEYDIVWILNDLFVTTECKDIINETRVRYRTLGKKPPVFIYYYPVDCHVNKWATGMLDVCDIPVCYTDHGREETLITKPGLKNRLRQIPHGVDTDTFKPATRNEIARWKTEMLRVSPDTTVVININRNSTRKQIPYSVLAFKEFRKRVPKSIMYLHMVQKDQGGDLDKIIEIADLSPKKDVLYPLGMTMNSPPSFEVVNKLYNCGDIFLTTHLGEGWGLTVTEAMACGVPVVAPDNTCMPEQLGKDSERGYLYPCKDLIYIDTSGFRKKGLIPDIVDKMLEVHQAGPKEWNPKVKAGLEYARSLHWDNVGAKWVTLFDEAMAVREKTKIVFTEAI